MNIKSYVLNLFSSSKINSTERRNFFYKFFAGSSLALGINSAHAHKMEVNKEKEERFPGDPPEHFMLFPFKEADQEYHNHVVGSVGAMVAKYEDNIDLVVVAFGKGIHVLVKNPKRPVDDKVKQRIKSLAGQGVEFHACNRTLTALGWTKDDVLPFVKIVEVGAADIMELQEQNYALMIW